MIDSASGWYSKHYTRSGEWMMLDAGKDINVKGIAIQTYKHHDYYPTSVKVYYWSDGDTYTTTHEVTFVETLHVLQDQKHLVDNGTVMNIPAIFPYHKADGSYFKLLFENVAAGRYFKIEVLDTSTSARLYFEKVDMNLLSKH